MTKGITKEQYHTIEPILDSLGTIYSTDPLREKAYRILRLNGLSEAEVRVVLDNRKVVELPIPNEEEKLG